MKENKHGLYRVAMDNDLYFKEGIRRAASVEQGTRACLDFGFVAATGRRVEKLPCARELALGLCGEAMRRREVSES